jgi:hypothetical protein
MCPPETTPSAAIQQLMSVAVERESGAGQLITLFG